MEGSNENFNMNTGASFNANALDPSWAWERLVVVDVGNGEIALHNSFHNRFVKIIGDIHSQTILNVAATESINVNALPSHFSWERYTVVHLGNGQIALHNNALNRFLAVDVQSIPPGTNDNLNVGTSAPKNITAAPSVYEKFTVVAG